MVLRPQDRILITGGIYVGRNGTIVQVNSQSHTINMDGMARDILHRFCVPQLPNNPPAGIPGVGVGVPFVAADWAVGGSMITPALVEILANFIVENQDLPPEVWLEILEQRINCFGHR
jgi:hypothetical protein